jgi:4-amino-4-deoxy-L-arabinose transferase-like glycosyltransferase
VNRTALLLAALTAALYLPRLSTVPVYLAPDEVFIALHAQSIASTGRDYGGRFLPLYIEYQYKTIDRSGQDVTHSGWLPPIIFYLMALFVKIFGLSEFTVRLPTVLVGIADVVLTYFIGRTLFRRETYGVLSAALLALTPAHLIHSRLGMDYLYPLPFLLAWLLALVTYLSRSSNASDAQEARVSLVFASTFALACGLFSYIAAGLAMPLYFVVTLAALAVERQPARAYAAAFAGFLVPAALYVPWVIAHPAAILDVLGKYGIGPAAGLTAAESARSFLSFHSIGDQLSHLWAFFDPRFLFFDGPMEPMYSTRTAGVFLLPIAVFLVAGLVAALRGRTRGLGLAILAGLIIAPVPATLVNVTDAIYRALELLPFVILVAVWGVQSLWESPSFVPTRRTLLWIGGAAAAPGVLYAAAVLVRQGRVPGGAVPLLLAGGAVAAVSFTSMRLRIGQLAAGVLLLVVPLQFAAFYKDYLTDYSRRTSLVFSGNIRGALEALMREADESNAPSIYLARLGPYNKGGIYWAFYAAKYGRADLTKRMIDSGAFDPDRVMQLAAGSVIVTNAGEGATDAAVGPLLAAGALEKTAVITEPDGTPTFMILRRTRG